MSDGGGESGRDYYEHSKGKKRHDDFGHAISKIAVAQICESVGFQIFQQSALNTLSDVAVRYVREIGKTANNYSNLAGRTEGNVFDIIQGLEDLGSSQGFSGASDINHCLAGSGVIQEITQYVGVTEEIPFAYSIPDFPVIKDRNPNPTFGQGETFDHIPLWLPAFPDPQTYLNSPSPNERDLESSTNKIENRNVQRKVEKSLLNLQKRLACNGSEDQMIFDPGDAAKAKRAAESNPFIAIPLRFGEKEVSSLVLPAKILDEAAERRNTPVKNHAQNHVSLLEAFTPAIEAMKSTVRDSEEGRKKVLLNTSSTVQFKFGIGKKSSCQLNPRNDTEKINYWFGEDNEKSHKKTRADNCLRESTENTQESAHL